MKIHLRKRRVRPRPRTMRISIEANIGAGKTTLIQRLGAADALGIPIYLEPVEEWREWLQLFYTDPLRWGLTFNLNALMSFTRVPSSEKILVERSPVSCHHVFTALQHASGHMNDLEYALFKKIYDSVAWTPDIVVYLKTDPSVCHERMRKRDRESERGVSLEYLEAIHERHEALMATANKRPIVIDGNQDADAVLADVLKNIKELMA